MESPIRKMVRGLIAYSATLRPLASSNNDLKRAYNHLCDVLDALNSELHDEDEGVFSKTWQKFPI
jgi:hypothetical protein